MLPVSGAEQLNTSEAIGARPMISHNGAYSRLLRPAPRGECGRKRFHRPSSLAFFLRSSISAVGCQRSPVSISRACCASLG